jgi:hypothetical protein
VGDLEVQVERCQARFRVRRRLPEQRGHHGGGANTAQQGAAIDPVHHRLPPSIGSRHVPETGRRTPGDDRKWLAVCPERVNFDHVANAGTGVNSS